MADLTALRKAARACLNESSTVVRRAVHGYVLPEISSGRSHFIREQFTTAAALSGASPDEGPAGNTWTASNWSKSGGVLTPTATGSTATGSIDSGSADGFISILVNTTATPATDLSLVLGFRMASSTWVGSSPASGWNLRVNPAGASGPTGTLSVDGVEAVAATVLVAGALTLASQIPVEVRLNGSNIQVWCNGVRVINHTSATHQTATRVGLGRAASATATVATVDDLFFASVPTCPLGVAGRDGNSIWTSASTTLDCGVDAGALLPLHVRWAKLGAPQSAAPNRWLVATYDDAGTVIRSSGAVVTSGDNNYITPATISMYATSSGLVGGAARVGTFRMEALLQSTGNTPSTHDWTIDSENAFSLNASTPVTTTNDFGRGYATVPVTVTSVQKPSAMVAYNEVATEGITLATQPFRAGSAPTIQPRQGNVNVPTKGGVGADWSSGVSSRTDTIDKNFTRASAGVQLLITMAAQSALNNDPAVLLEGAAPTGFALTVSPSGEAGFTAVDSGTDDDAWTADPRLTVYHLMLLNDNSYANPPTSEDTIPKNRLVTDLAFVAARVRNANAVGQNSIVWTRSLRDSAQLVAEVFGDAITTGTHGGEAGWDSTGGTTPGAWSASLPGGGWVHKRTITSPTGATGADMLINSSETFTLFASDPSLRPVVGGGAYGATADKDHWHPGDALLVGLALINTATGKILAPDTGTATMYIGRFNQTLGRAEYLAADLTWMVLSTTVAAYAWPLTASAGDPNVFIKVFTATDTAGFSMEDLHLVGNCKFNSTPYSGPGYTPTVGTANGHGKNQFDGTDFATGFSFK